MSLQPPAVSSSPWPILALLGALAAPGAARAGKVDTVRRLIDETKLDVAQSKCEKWAAHAVEDDIPLREACAEAWWPVAEATDTARAWSEYRARWQATTWDARAKRREAAAALRDLTERATEDDIRLLVEAYADTDSAPGLQEAMVHAAIRDCRTDDQARRVAETWPGHARLPELVARFPGAFLKVTVDGRTVSVATEPPVALTGDFTPKVRWVAVDPSGAHELWDIAARQWLAEWGVPETVSAAVPVATDGGPSIPLCSVPGLPPGVGPGIEVQVGDGVHVEPLEWHRGCGPKDWPAFAVLTDDRLTGLSLRPGHYVDLQSPTVDGDRKSIRGYLGAPVGIPQLHDGVVLQQLGPAWIADPVSGGMPWATARPPSAQSLPLTDALRSAPIPAGWSLDKTESGLKVAGTALAKMPEQLRIWNLPGTEARVIPHLVRGTFGLRADNAVSPTPTAPILGPSGGWKRAPDGSLLREPPAGGDIAGIRQVDADSIEAALGVAAGVGLSRDRIDPLDAWRVDVDGDGTAEIIIRTRLDGEGAVIVIDPLEGKEAFTADKARVFAFAEPMVLANNRAAGLPFAFRKGRFVYMAWSATEVLGRTKRKHSLVVLRTDGAGIRSESWHLPAP